MSLENSTGFFVLAVTLTVSALSFPASCAAIPFEQHPEQVLEGKLDRPVVLVFAARWCGWCRKMESVTLTDKAVQELADDFIWLQIDIDQHAQLAAQFGVRGVPETIILNQDGGIIGSASGYVPPERFVTFLTTTLESPREAILPVPVAIQQFLAAADDQLDVPLTQLVTILARPNRHGREVILQAFQQKGAVAADRLVQLLSHQHLAIRAAAAQALREATGADLPFNPFAAPADRDSEADAWSEWLQASRG